MTSTDAAAMAAPSKPNDKPETIARSNSATDTAEPISHPKVPLGRDASLSHFFDSDAKSVSASRSKLAAKLGNAQALDSELKDVS